MHTYFTILNRAFFDLIITEVLEKEGYTEIFSAVDSSNYWNGVNKINIHTERLDEVVWSVEKDFLARKRNPAFWVTNEDFPPRFEEYLLQSGYTLHGIDHWMQYKNLQQDTITQSFTLDIKRVENEKLLQDYFTVFTAAWNDDDHRYIDAYKKNMQDPRYKETSKLYVGYQENVPVTVAAYVTYNNTCILHSIATAPEHRRKGYAGQITQFVIQQCGKDEIFLQTDVTEAAYSVYKRLGFHDLMDVKIYAKKTS